MLTDEQIKSAQDAGKSMKVSLEILTERFRQISDEEWSLEHDDEHDGGEMAMAAGCYALHSSTASIHRTVTGIPLSWPWDPKWWKPTDQRRDLVKAAALIVAEIERLDRALQQQERADG